LPTQEFTGSASSSSSSSSSCISTDGDNSHSCGICLEEFQKGECLKTMPCLHRYHRECIDKWLKQCAKCPVCKHEIH
jgi:hypothetical protein